MVLVQPREDEDTIAKRATAVISTRLVERALQFFPSTAHQIKGEDKIAVLVAFGSQIAACEEDSVLSV